MTEDLARAGVTVRCKLADDTFAVRYVELVDGEHGIVLDTATNKPASVDLPVGSLHRAVAQLELSARAVDALAALGDLLGNDPRLVAAREAAESLHLDVRARWRTIPCEQCAAAVTADPAGSLGVWVHDRALGDLALALDEDHAARPPEDLA